MAGGRVRENAVGLIRLGGDGGSCGRSLIPCMSSVDGEPLGRGRGGGRSEVSGPKKRGGSPPVLLMGLSYLLGPRTADRGQLTSLSLPALTVPLASPSGPLQRKRSSGASPWRSYWSTSVSGGHPACSLSVSCPPSSSPPLPGSESASGPREVAFPCFLGPVMCPRCWERLRPLVWPWSLLLPAPLCP